jgi:hypothetical protein
MLKSLRKAFGRKSVKASGRTVPRLEALEDRWLPSGGSYSVNGAGGPWSIPTTWIKAGGGIGVPGDGDSVTIDQGTVTNSNSVGTLTGLAVTGGTLNDNGGISSSGLTVMSGLLKLGSTMTVGSLTMTGGTINSDATNPGTLTVQGGPGSSATWTNGVIGNDTNKGTLNIGVASFTFGRSDSKLGFDMTIGYGAGGTQADYLAASTQLVVTNDAKVTVASGAKLSLKEDTGGSTSTGRTIGTNAASTTGYLDISGTVEDFIIGAGPVFTMKLPTYIEQYGVLEVDGDSGDGGSWAAFNVPLATPRRARLPATRSTRPPAASPGWGTQASPGRPAAAVTSRPRTACTVPACSRPTGTCVGSRAGLRLLTTWSWPVRCGWTL